jgi:hypothetical protein
VFLSAVRLDHRHGNRYKITIFSDNNLGIRTRSNICKVSDKLVGIKVQYFLAAAHHQINANNPTPASTTTASNGQKIRKGELQFMFSTVTGWIVGKRKMTLRKAVQEHAQTLMYHEYRPKLIGPGVKFSGQMTLHMMGMQ